jgi:hypothetical protein
MAALTTEIDRWDNGNMRVCRKYSEQTGDLREIDYYRQNGTLQQREKYGDYGHKVEEAYFDSTGRLKENFDGWAMLKWKYEKGRMVEECYYGADGKLKERKEYNDEGDLVAKQYVGDKGIDPSEEYNPEPPLLGEETVSYYDSYGRPEGQTSVIKE